MIADVGERVRDSLRLEGRRVRWWGLCHGEAFVVAVVDRGVVVVAYTASGVQARLSLYGLVPATRD